MPVYLHSSLLKSKIHPSERGSGEAAPLTPVFLQLTRFNLGLSISAFNQPEEDQLGHYFPFHPAVVSLLFHLMSSSRRSLEYQLGLFLNPIFPRKIHPRLKPQKSLWLGQSILNPVEGDGFTISLGLFHWYHINLIFSESKQM